MLGNPVMAAKVIYIRPGREDHPNPSKVDSNGMSQNALAGVERVN
jgi:hypothetical protein